MLSLLDIMHVSTKHVKPVGPEWSQLSSRGGRREGAGRQGTLQPPAEAVKCGELWQVERAQHTANLGAAASSDRGVAGSPAGDLTPQQEPRPASEQQSWGSKHRKPEKEGAPSSQLWWQHHVWTVLC